MKLCKTCASWKNQQAELEYSKFNGICTCHKWYFTTSNSGDVKVLDRNNRSGKHMGVQRFESQKNEVPFGATDKSQYCFVTDEYFGCIHHNSPIKKKK